MVLELRPLRLEDEDQFLSSPYTEHPYGYYEAGMEFPAYLARLDEVVAGVDLPSGHVPNVRYYGFVDAVLVGGLAVRLELKGMLVTLGGHIGYQVLEPYRRRGYGTEMLRLAIPNCADLGLDRVLVTCDEDNFPSRKIIESNGGQYEETIHNPNLRTPKRRYWIETS